MGRALSARVLLAGSLLAAGCSHAPTRPRPAPVGDVLERVLVDGAEAGAAYGPASAGGDPAPLVTGAGSWIPGAALALRVRVTAATTELRVGVSGARGAFRVAVPPAGGPHDLLLVVLPRAARSEAFELAIVAASPLHSTRAAAHALTPRRDAERGPFEISLSWPDPVDMDLHVETPDSVDVYRGAPEGGGGALDLDSNAGCVLDGVQAEHVAWGADPPRGVYTVRVDLWSACLAPDTLPYVVTLRDCNGAALHTGSLTLADEDQGEAHAGRTVARVTPAACPVP